MPPRVMWYSGHGKRHGGTEPKDKYPEVIHELGRRMIEKNQTLDTATLTPAEERALRKYNML